MQKRLYRSRKEKMVAGVAGGIAEYFELDPVIVRIGFVLLTVISGVGLITYLICIFVMPKEPCSAEATAQEEVLNETCKDDMQQGNKRRSILGIILVIAGILLLAKNYFPFFDCDSIVPALFLLSGIGLLATSKNHGVPKNEA